MKIFTIIKTILSLAIYASEIHVSSLQSASGSFAFFFLFHNNIYKIKFLVFLIYSIFISYKFSFVLSGDREVLSGGKACDYLDNVPCSTCAKYLDGLPRPKPLEFEDAKCVWLLKLMVVRQKRLL